jgi:hypothetical protein
MITSLLGRKVDVGGLCGPFRGVVVAVTHAMVPFEKHPGFLFLVVDDADGELREAPACDCELIEVTNG